MAKPAAKAASVPSGPPPLQSAQQLELWSAAHSTASASVLTLVQTLEHLTLEVSQTRAQLLADERSSSEVVSKLLSQEASARELAAACVARAERAEAALALAPAELTEAVVAARREGAAEVEALQLALREKTIEVELLHDAKLEKAENDRRIAELEASLAASAEASARTESMLERRNAADRESLRVLMLEHVKEMKRGLLEKSAESMGDNIKRMVAEHEQLLAELAFSSKRGEEVALLNQKLVQVRGKPHAG
jgi:hypothetical protein